MKKNIRLKGPTLLNNPLSWLVHNYGFSSAETLETLGHDPGAVAAPLRTLKVAGRFAKTCSGDGMVTLDPEGSVKSSQNVD